MFAVEPARLAPFFHLTRKLRDESVRRKTEGGIIVEADVKYETPSWARKQSRARKCTHQNNFSAASRISFAAAKENVEIYAALP